MSLDGLAPAFGAAAPPGDAMTGAGRGIVGAIMAATQERIRMRRMEQGFVPHWRSVKALQRDVQELSPNAGA